MRSIGRLIGLGILLLAACRRGEIPGELGRTEAEYVSRYGEAAKSPMTPNQAAFTAASGLRVLVRFAGDRSAEEVWVIDEGDDAMPAVLRERVRRLVASVKTPVRTVVFKAKVKPAAEVLDEPAGGGVLLVERSGGRLKRAALCADRAACWLLEQLQASERASDELMGRTAKSMGMEYDQ